MRVGKTTATLRALAGSDDSLLGGSGHQMMDRRCFVRSLSRALALLAVPLAADAQQAGKSGGSASSTWALTTSLRPWTDSGRV